MREKEELSRVKLGFKVWFNVNDHGLLGPTGFKILQLVLQGYPLTQVSQKLGLSYRFVRGYIDRIEKRCGIEIVEKRRGVSGGTKIRPCGTILYYLYEQLSKIVECSISCYEKILPEGPLRDTLYVQDGYAIGLLDVIGDVNEGDVIVVPPLRNSSHKPLTLRPKVWKKRTVNGITITTVAVFEKVDVADGKIRIDPLAIGIYKSSAAPRTYPRAVIR